MKIMVFRDGWGGEVVTLPGEHPLSEIGELLGGDVKEPLIRITSRMALCVRADGGGEGRYAVGRDYWQRPELYAGPCAVVRMDLDGHIWDMKKEDQERVRGMVWPMEEVADA